MNASFKYPVRARISVFTGISVLNHKILITQSHRAILSHIRVIKIKSLIKTKGFHGASMTKVSKSTVMWAVLIRSDANGPFR